MPTSYAPYELELFRLCHVPNEWSSHFSPSEVYRCCLEQAFVKGDDMFAIHVQVLREVYKQWVYGFLDRFSPAFAALFQPIYDVNKP